MTVNTTSSSVTLTGNGANNQWPFGFVIPDASSISVSLIDNSVSPPTVVALGLGTYSVTGLGSASGGIVTYPISGTPIPSTAQINISRSVPLVQSADLTNQDGFYPDVLENALDSLEMQIQQINGLISQLFALAAGSSTSVVGLTALLISFSNAGYPLVHPDGGAIGNVQRALEAVKYSFAVRTELALNDFTNAGVPYTLDFSGVSTAQNDAALVAAQAQTDKVMVTTGTLRLASAATMTDAPQFDGRGAVKFPSGNIIRVGQEIRQSTTLVAYGDFPDIATAHSYIENRSIKHGVSVKIQVPNGTRSLPQTIFPKHPQGGQIKIIGNLTDPTQVVFNYDASNFKPALEVDGPYACYIDGMTINGNAWTSHGVWTGTTAGFNACLLARNGGILTVGSMMRINKCYYGIRAIYGGVVEVLGGSGGNTVTEAGDCGIHAFAGGRIKCWDVIVYSVYDAANNLGAGILAEQGSAIDAERAQASSCLIGLGAFSGSALWAPGLKSFGNGKGVLLDEGAGSLSVDASGNIPQVHDCTYGVVVNGGKASIRGMNVQTINLDGVNLNAGKADIAGMTINNCSRWGQYGSGFSVFYGQASTYTNNGNGNSQTGGSNTLFNQSQA